MNKVVMFERIFKSVNVVTSMGDVLVLVSEGSDVKIKTINKLTGETNIVEGIVLKLVGKKMEVDSPDIAYPVVIKFSEVQEIEVIL